MSIPPLDSISIWQTLRPSRYLETGEYADVVLVAADGIRVKAHRLVLCAACKLLRKALSNASDLDDETVVVVPDFTGEQIQRFLHLVYGKAEAAKDWPEEFLHDLRRGWCTDVFADPDVFSKGMSNSYYSSACVAPIKDESKRDKQEHGGQKGECASAPCLSSKEMRPAKQRKAIKRKSSRTISRSGSSEANRVDSSPSLPKLRTPCSQLAKVAKPKASKPRSDRIRTSVLDRNSSPGDFRCLNCSRTFLILAELETHVKLVHSQPDNQSINTAELLESEDMTTDEKDQERVLRGRRRQMVCLECDEKFHAGPDFDSHVATYHDLSDYGECIHCKKMCGSKRKLDEHEFLCMPLPLPSRAGKYKNRRKHTAIANIDVPFLADKPNQCSYKGCNYKNDRQSRIRSHYLSKHCRQRCPYCEKILSVGHMERHIIMNHTKQFNFVCHLCSKGFFKQGDLSNHIDEEHVKELKHICDLCGKGFYSQAKLYSHTYRAHLHNEWKCEPCTKVYSARKSLIKHLKAYHNGEGIADLFKDEKGNFKQVREYRHVTESLNYTVDTVILDKSTVEPYLLPDEGVKLEEK